jgi:hypothetical protein
MAIRYNTLSFSMMKSVKLKKRQKDQGGHIWMFQLMSSYNITYTITTSKSIEKISNLTSLQQVMLLALMRMMSIPTQPNSSHQLPNLHQLPKCMCVKTTFAISNRPELFIQYQNRVQ